MQGIGDSSQGFANAIIFVIFTKNIRDSFIKCIRCGKEDFDDDIADAGQVQRSHPTTDVVGDVEPSRDREDQLSSASTKVSLVHGSLGSNQSHKSQYFDN